VYSGAVAEKNIGISHFGSAPSGLVRLFTSRIHLFYLGPTSNNETCRPICMLHLFHKK
jgi:hypothetical protein